LAFLCLLAFIALGFDYELVLVPLIAMAIETTEAFIDRYIQERRAAVVTGEHAKCSTATMCTGRTIPLQDRAEGPLGDIQVVSGAPCASRIDASPKASLRTVE
jgi:hypothetical protein